MKSQRAKEYITPATCTAQEYAERFGGRELVVSRWDVSTAIELAEQEAEERMREKAIEALCAANCPQGCSFGADGNIGCGAKARFIQKLNEE